MLVKSALPPLAGFGTVTARGLLQVSHDVADLDAGGRWAVCVGFEGEAVLARFEHWTEGGPAAAEVGTWRGPVLAQWSSSLSREEFEGGVAGIRGRIAAGAVYQVNLCRLLSAPMPDPAEADPVALARQLAVGNPAPHGGFLRLPGLAVASASPELFLRRRGSVLATGPIKGTGVTAADLTDKDRAENLMIVDLMRNDLARVCRAGSVAVPHLLAVERHPGLVHLVSTVTGELLPDLGWSQIMAALFPPGSVSGAPKLAALEVIRSFEPVARGPYCGAFGWIDADSGRAELAVAIRTFWVEEGVARFGTGAGITWGSDAEAEWDETELKARRLIALASDRSFPEPVEGGAP